MTEKQGFGSFFDEMRQFIKDYFDARIGVARLKMTRTVAKLGGFFLWLIISLMMLLLFSVFLGIFLGFWLSELLGSYVKGFGLTALLLLLIIALLALFRKALFVNPIIRSIISRSANQDDNELNDRKH